MSDSITAETRNETASSRRIVSTDANTRSAPAASGPRTESAAKLAWMRPLALTSSLDSTRLGIAPNSAATKKIDRVEETNTTA